MPDTATGCTSTGVGEAVVVMGGLLQTSPGKQLWICFSMKVPRLMGLLKRVHIMMQYIMKFKTIKILQYVQQI